MRLLLIFNPQAARGSARKLLPDIENVLREKNVSCELLLTARPGHATELVQQTDLSGYDGIIAAGGDGTLFEVINGYYRNPAVTRPPVGVIPTGTGNAFARELDLRMNDWRRAIDIICAKQIKKVDVGKFSTNGQKFFYVNILGLGFVADVGKTAHGLKMFGNTAYTMGVFYQLLFLRSYPVTIVADGQTWQDENIFIEISNSQYTGTSFLMAPQAQVDDGLLDVTVLKKISRRRLIKTFPTIFNGSHIHLDCVNYFQAKKITIKTNSPKVLNADGELMGSTPLEVECLPKHLDVFWNNETTGN